MRRRDRPDGEYYAARAKLGVEVATCSIQQLLEAGRSRDALKFAERISALAQGKAGLKARIVDGIDLMAAIPMQDQWPKRFVTNRLPQLRKQVDERQKKHLLAAEKTRSK